MIEPEYLGDGVYAEHMGHHVNLRVNDHRSLVAVVVEDVVAVNLIRYLERAFPGSIEKSKR